MTSQTVTAIVGSEGFSRTFGVTSTDGQWSNVTSTLSSQAIGLEIPNTSISFVQVANDAEHTMLWRIIDGRTLQVRRRRKMCLLWQPTSETTTNSAYSRLTSIHQLIRRGSRLFTSHSNNQQYRAKIPAISRQMRSRQTPGTPRLFRYKTTNNKSSNKVLAPKRA